MANRPKHVQLEIPRFGEFARQYARVGSKEVAECLALRRRTAGRLGAIMAHVPTFLTEPLAAELPARLLGEG